MIAPGHLKSIVQPVELLFATYLPFYVLSICHSPLIPGYAAMHYILVQAVIVAFFFSIHRSADMLQQPKKSGKNSASYGLRHFTHQPSKL